MKFKVTLKNPDDFYEAFRDAAQSSLDEIEGLEQAEVEELVEKRHAKISEQCREWVKYGEYITIEFDTDARTATVCKV